MCFALNLKETPNFSHDIVFTNPICQNYYNTAGELIGQKGVFCTDRDKKLSKNSFDTPLSRILKVINNKKNKEFWIASFDISEESIISALCSRLSKGDFSLRILMHSTENMLSVLKLNDCRSETSKFHFRPITQQADTSLFHAKMILVNPKNDFAQLIFSSANLTSATFFKHENWHFLKLISTSHFFQKHICAFMTMFEFGQQRSKFIDSYQHCIESISVAMEDDYQLFVTPGEGEEYLKKIFKSSFLSSHITMASHRLTLKPLLKVLHDHLQRGRVLDIYMDSGFLDAIAAPYSFQKPQEFFSMLSLMSKGARLHPTYTNQQGGIFFHHKFLLMNQQYIKGEDLLFIGSSNYTNIGVLDSLIELGANKSFYISLKKTHKVNFENNYLVKNKKVIKKLKDYLIRFKEQPFILNSRTPTIYKVSK